MDQDINRIISIQDNEPINQADMAYVIQEYIKERKGNGVIVALPDDHPAKNAMPPEVFIQMVLFPEVSKMSYAYGYAKQYYVAKYAKENA